jgi:hypothetical protein
MVYLAADNDLDPYSSPDLAEMMAVGSTGRVNIIVQYDGFQKPAVRYKVEKGSLTKLADLGEVNMASGDALKDFITYVTANYPAEHYALVLWSHGDGWKSGSARPTAKSVLVDWDNNGRKSDALANNLVAKGIADSGVLIDVLGVDACILADIEAAYEFRNVARYLVASEDLVSLYGWDYRNLLTRLTYKPDMSAEELARAGVESYGAQMNTLGMRNQTMSAIRMADLPAVVTAVDSMARSLKARISDPETLSLITNSRNSVQNFDLSTNTYVDLADLGLLMEGAASPVAAAVSKAVIAEYHGPDRPNARGISVVFYSLPDIYQESVFLGISTYDPDYINLGNTRVNPVGFLDTTSWGQFLDDFYSKMYPDIYQKLKNLKYLDPLS